MPETRKRCSQPSTAERNDLTRCLSLIQLVLPDFLYWTLRWSISQYNDIDANPSKIVIPALTETGLDVSGDAVLESGQDCGEILVASATGADGIKTADRQSGDRLYRRLAQRLFDEIAAGKYKIGERLPAERELAAEHDVSRPVAREALIALEVQGFIEVRLGSGAYVCRIPGDDEQPGFAITAFELTEARLLFEGEAAALAAVHITDEELETLAQLVEAIRTENAQPEVTEMADREFHFTIARATRNVGVLLTIEELWRLRSTSPECALLHYRARSAKVRPVVEEHVEILDALRTHDPAAARAAMRAHLSAVMEHLLFTTEERAVEEARRTVANARKRYSSAGQ